MATPAKGTTKYAKRKTPASGIRRTADDQPKPDPAENTAPIALAEQARAELINLVNGRIRESINARAACGIEDEWREADSLFDGFDDLNTPTTGMRIRDKTPGPTRDGAKPAGATLVLNITRPKTTAGTSRAKEMLVPTNQKPFEVKATPVPDLEAVSTDPAQASQMVQLGDGTQAPALMVVEKMKERASESATKESDWIDDRFVEGAVYGQMRKVIDDAGQRGTGCLKGPYPVEKVTRRWKKDANGVNQLKLERKAQPTSKRVRIQDCFPDPACGDNIHNGSFFNERDYMTARALRLLARDPEYDQAAIADALLEGPQTYAMMMSADLRSRRKPGDMVSESALFEVWYSYGDVTPEALIAMGVKDSLLGNADVPDARTTDATNISEPAPDESGTDAATAAAEHAFDPTGTSPRKGDLGYEPNPALTREQKAALTLIPAIVTMVNGKPIRACIQPQSTGESPYDFFRWAPIDGQPWGRGLPMLMRSAQIIVKQGLRKLLENSGQASGPQIAISDNLEPIDNVYEITGRKLWRFTPNDLIKDIRAAMAFFTIPSIQKELMALIEFGLRMADYLTNLPMLMQGDQQAGVAPETLGGLKMFESNAMSPLRDIAKGYDDDIIIPHLGRYHDYFLEHVPGAGEGDTSIQALGSTALIQREEGRLFLLQLFPVKNDPDLRINPAKLAKEMARANGYDMTLIQYTEDEWKQVQAEKAKLPPPEDPSVTRTKLQTASAEKIATERVQNDASAEHARQIHEEEDRKLRVQELDLKERLGEIELSIKSGASLQQIKADLVMKAADIRVKRDEMQLKLSPANPTHQGI